MMIKPGFYDSFQCIGGECDFTCCMEWKIAVDENTAEKWKKTDVPSGEAAGKKKLFGMTRIKEGMRVIALDEHKTCPMLNKDGLCNVVIAYGDNMLSETCQIFPREKHVFDDRTEYALMPCCPVVVDMMAKEVTPEVIPGGEERQTPETGTSGEEHQTPAAGPLSEESQTFDTGTSTDHLSMDRMRKIRTYLMELCTDAGKNIGEILTAAFYLLGEFEKNEALTTEEADTYKEQIFALIRDMGISAEDSFVENLELFLDLCENYRKKGIYQRYLETTAVLAEEILEEDADDGWEADASSNIPDDCKNAEFAGVWRSYQKLFHSWLYYEIYSDILNADSEISDMCVRLQWITMEYVFMRTYCYLYFVENHRLEYTDVRNAIVLGSRMMGYEEDDIYEYLENSFESLYWDIGYLAMIAKEF